MADRSDDAEEGPGAARGAAGAVDRRVQKWRNEIALYDREFQEWEKRGNKIVKRFRDDRDGDDDRRTFSLLYANTETMAPVLYGATPKAVVVRRNKDRAPTAALAALIAQRMLNYLIERDDSFDDACQAAVQDYQLPGRGEIWARYEADEEEFIPRIPALRDGAAPMADDEAGEGAPVSGATYRRADTGESLDPADVKTGEDGAAYVEDAPQTRPVNEDVRVDYIDWRDFGHTAGARRWEEVEAVWKHVYMTRAELKKRFGAKGRDVKLAHQRRRERDSGASDPARSAKRRARVTEIWIKPERTTIWISDGYDRGLLDEKPDMYQLPGFFPGPKPLLALTTTEQLVPVPDYVQYQDQAEEIDGLTARIALLQKSLRARGLYPGSLAEIATLLSDTLDTELVPVGDWAQLIEKGGLKDAVHWFPVEIFAEVIKVLVEIRQKVKDDAYEITGISDIIRGQSVASETATAQDIKNRWGSIRVRKRQQAVQKFVRALLQTMFDIACANCSDETILAWSDAEELTQDKAALQEALTLLRDKDRRRFKIDIETDSTVLVDETAEKQQRSEFLTALGTFLQSALPILQSFPMLAPMLGQMLMFTVRSFRPGSELEPTIEKAMGQLMQAAMAPKPPQIDPAAQAAAEKAKAETQATMAKAHSEIAATQADQQRKDLELAADAERQDRALAQDAVHADADRRAMMHGKVIAAVVAGGRGRAGGGQ